MGLQCNARCVMCYQTDFSARYNMPAEIYREHLLPLYPRLREVKIQGGEPLIMSNCKDFAGLARGYPNLRLSTTTNGLVLSRFWLETLARQGGTVNFSLNAATAETYARIVGGGEFRRVTRNLSRLAGARPGSPPLLTASMVVLGLNFLEIAGFLRLSRELGADGAVLMLDPVLSLRNLPDAGRCRAELEAALAWRAETGFPVEGLDLVARKLGMASAGAGGQAPRPVCPMPFRNLVVDADGGVRVCCDTWREVGNTYRQPIAEILEGEALRRFRSKVARQDYRWCSPECPENPSPSPAAHLDKFMCLAREDPRGLARKAAAKLRRLGALARG
jgi:MoaA/NifB/PqqE/SkfB family radical SAM enzyme